MKLILAIIAGVLFALHGILWVAVPNYRSNMLLSVAGVILSVAVIVGEVGVS